MSFLHREPDHPIGQETNSEEPQPEEQHFVFPDSSNLLEATFTPAAGLLEVTFTGGGKYQYFDVPENTYRDLTTAYEVVGSSGKFFREAIRGQFDTRRVDTDDSGAAGEEDQAPSGD